jgi:polyribonucleotide nucleotidyltransferase
MDFKVAGSVNGVTALQMDIKIHELSKDILEKALDQAKAGRLHILDEMLKAIQTPRGDLSPYAPKIMTITINPDKIRDIIGPGGKVIRAIQSETNTRIEIDDSGLVKIAAVTSAEGDRPSTGSRRLSWSPKPGPPTRAPWSRSWTSAPLSRSCRGPTGWCISPSWPPTG